jgi:peptidoglycan-N-acetylglucosamine deacetylase
MVFSFGSMQKLHWITAPRKPYFTDPDKLWKKGSGDVFEIPVSSFGLPYIGTLMRISPVINKILGRTLHMESLLNKKPIVFLIHPNELITEELVQGKVSRRSTNINGYYLKDKLRRKLKLRNLGPEARVILEEELKFFLSKDYKFISMKDYYLEFKNNINV